MVPQKIVGYVLSRVLESRDNLEVGSRKSNWTVTGYIKQMVVSVVLRKKWKCCGNTAVEQCAKMTPSNLRI